jgi:hypothetical protein
MPVFIAQGAADALVSAGGTEAYVKSLCQRGKVRFDVMYGVGAAFIGGDAAHDAVAWMASRFGGSSPPDDCGRT